jgi:hypothetical protein
LSVALTAASILVVGVLGFASTTALAQSAPPAAPPPADPSPPPTSTLPPPDPAPTPPPPPAPKPKPKPPPPPPPPPPPTPPAVVVSPPAVSPPPPSAPRTAAKPKTRTKAQIRQARLEAARLKAAARKRAAAAKRAKLPPPPTPPPGFSIGVDDDPAPTDVKPVSSVATGTKRDLMTSPFVRILLMSAAGLALIFLILAALPLAALERLLAVEAHYRAEQAASFVDGHRLDIAVAGVATLLVAAVVAIPSVTG